MRLLRLAPIALLALGCEKTDVADAPGDAPTWNGEIAEIVGDNCAGCHVDGDIAPFGLNTYAEASSVAGLIASVVEAGTMPPWQAGDDCRDYEGDFSMTESEKALLLAWVEGGSPEGDGQPREAIGPEVVQQELDVTLSMPEPYIPTGEAPDDYRCVVLDWPETEAGYVTGFEVLPDSREQVHHVLAYKGLPEDAQMFYDWDEAEPGLGYTCYGAPTGPGGRATTQLLGGWAPGIRTAGFPEGTGLYVEPGSVVILQMHYNTSATNPVADETQISFAFTDQVEREAVSTLVTEPLWTLGTTMEIPAGEASVVHESSVDLPFFLSVSESGFDLAPDEALELHALGMHMHQLGRRGRVSLQKADGSEACLVDIPNWDFNWQGRFQLAETVLVEPGDKIHIECEWDNSGPDAVDTYWGDGTSDEMCLSGMYLSRL